MKLEPLSRASPQEQLSPSDTALYQAIVGSLSYLMNCSRPDLAFAINRLAQFTSCPAERHLIAAKHTPRYLHHTTSSCLVLGPSSNPNKTPTPLSELRIQGWFDASWADDPDDRRSMFGYAIVYDCSVLLWKSKKHRATTLSTTDAEYVAATEITRELSFIRNIFNELGIPFLTPVQLHGDNINANNLANSTYIL